MNQINFAGNTKIIVSDDVLAVFCDNGLKTVSSAFYNGGCKQVKAVLNVGVPEGYNDRSLHLDPLGLITSSAAKLGFTKDYLAMVTAAKIKNYSLITKKADDFSVSVAVTAGCKHGESSGEEMNVQEIRGTINIIVLIDANPTDSCMVASLITATEAKSAALRDLDVRSLYTGDSATGSITDSVTIASTHQGKTIRYGGPASKLGKAIGYCTRKAVTEALIKQEPIWACRTVLDRLKERHFTPEKLSAELSKVKGIVVDEKVLAGILKNKPLASAYLLAATKLDDDYKKNLLPAELGDAVELSKCFGTPAPSQMDCSKMPGYDSVDLPPFLKHALIKIVMDALPEGKPKRLK
ncbi:MAG TPA: adenosylcobinamide amidohydrolase [Verrucomicrobiae bacterium]|nr:adenosylcobinamide amidohydrolase [Verrucomicrobiae bacterium]